MRRIMNTIGIALVAGAVLGSASACGPTSTAKSAGSSDVSVAPGTSASAGAGTGAGAGTSSSASPSASPSPTHPAGPAMLLDSITPADTANVGVAMPISIVFTKAVATSARKAIEQHLTVSASVPTTGAWHWFSSRRVDWRPQNYWKSGTKVSVTADLTDVGDGNGDYGTHSYQHTFTIGSDVETTVSVTGHSMTVSNAGKVVRTMPIDAGSAVWPSWDGTMAVIDKSKEVRMTSCSVGISCDKSSPDYYDLTLPWDVHLTDSGTYVHYSTGDPQPGHSVGSHGCVHLSLTNAEWFYNYVKQGDPITITGSPRGKAAADNGYASFNLSWSQWLAASATGAQQTGTL
ncbi:Ig-like domain-containing protein [Streptacidiphilus sp. N1-5]|uniref:Ig-like domain-containing protein n=1 Tax=Streptacidiphilus cavernicola TaxID=3342716 RepID=A0ABV6UJD8_9ACTN